MILIKQSCELLNKFYDDYNKWLLIAFTLKDLYLSVNKQYKKISYKIFDEFSQKSNNYNKIQNKNIFLSLESKIDSLEFLPIDVIISFVKNPLS